MAWGKQKEIETILKPYQDQINFLKERIDDLKEENGRLLEALVAAKSPEAYREMLHDKASLENYNNTTEEDRKKARIQNQTVQSYLEGLEQPLFRTFDDVKSYIANQYGGVDERELEPSSIHDNSES